jgi:hypothetical protein
MGTSSLSRIRKYETPVPAGADGDEKASGFGSRNAGLFQIAE